MHPPRIYPSRELLYTEPPQTPRGHPSRDPAHGQIRILRLDSPTEPIPSREKLTPGCGKEYRALDRESGGGGPARERPATDLRTIGLRATTQFVAPFGRRRPMHGDCNMPTKRSRRNSGIAVLQRGVHRFSNPETDPIPTRNHAKARPEDSPKRSAKRRQTRAGVSLCIEVATLEISQSGRPCGIRTCDQRIKRASEPAMRVLKAEEVQRSLRRPARTSRPKPNFRRTSLSRSADGSARRTRPIRAHARFAQEERNPDR